ncbi:MAG: hypothetical protein Kow00108_09090 [Calditrichia bacterium]
MKKVMLILLGLSAVIFASVAVITLDKDTGSQLYPETTSSISETQEGLTDLNGNRLFVGTGVSRSPDIARQKAKLNAYEQIAKAYGMNSDQRSYDVVIKDTRIVKYTHKKRNNMYIYECYIKINPR